MRQKCTICGKPLEDCPHVPSKRYDIFIKAFEKFVSERQEEVRLADRLMRPYEIVREAIERCKFDPSVRIDLRLETNEIKVKILVHEDQPPSLFAPLERFIGEELVAAKLHDDGIPAVGGSQFYRNLVWKMAAIDEKRPPCIAIEKELPLADGKHVLIIKKEVYRPAYTSTEYEVQWTDQQVITEKVTHDPDQEAEVPF